MTYNTAKNLSKKDIELSAFDSKAQQVNQIITKNYPQKKISCLLSAKVYFICAEMTRDEIEQLTKNIFVDPVVESYFINELPTNLLNQNNNKDLKKAPALEKFSWKGYLEINFKQGVTDNIARSSAKGIADFLRPLKKRESISSASLYLFNCYDEIFLPKLAREYLYNPLIEDLTCLKAQGNIFVLPVQPFKNTFAKQDPLFHTFDLNHQTCSLMELSEKMTLSLDQREMEAIRDYYLRPETIKNRQEKNLPKQATDVELEVLAQTWSEHCKHKIFSADIYHQGEDGKEEYIQSLYKTYIKDTTTEISTKRKDLLSVFTDNAGVFEFDKNYALCLKVETHNSPSALDPYGGAMTGIVGVNRDIIGTGIGAKPIFNTNVFCFAPPDYHQTLPNRLIHPARIFQGVHAGVKDGGNESGIPTVNGSILFDKRFVGKPLVFCGTGGLMQKKILGKNSWEKEIIPGDRIIMVGEE